MKTNELDALGVSTDLITAANALGISKSTAYASARAGTFPCRVIRVGSRYVVPTAELRAVLGLATTPQDAACRPADPTRGEVVQPVAAISASSD